MEFPMTVNLIRYSRSFTFACIALLTITLTTASATTLAKISAGEAEKFVTKLKIHYQKTLPIAGFSMTHNYLYLGHNASYTSWDYKAPNRYTAFKVTEFDLEKEHYFENVIHNYSGGRKHDEVHFQNDTESFRYAKNGVPYGKHIVRQSMDDYEGFKNLILVNVDFFAVRPLLEETNIATTIKLHQDKVSGKTTLIYKSANDEVAEYVFGDSPLRLLSLNNKSMRRVYFYDDYQTTNGITFARSIVQYTNGDMTPTFIKHIENIDIIDGIEPEKLQIPQGYGSEHPKSDGVLVSKEIAPGLYLVTDSSARRNSLFKINGDEIMVFGASGYTALAKKTIKLIGDKFPNKKINSVYVTHPHRSDIAGLKVYVDQGIKILADEYTITAIKAYPDFADDIDSFKFQTIASEQVIAGAHFYVLENQHSKRQSFVHFKDSEIIFQADFLHIAFDNTIAMVIPSYTRTFIDFVRHQQLKFTRIVGNYQNNNISVEVMNKTYDAMM